MRIALFTAYFPPHIGGVERYTLNIANQLTRMGHEVTVVTSSPTGNSERQKCPFTVIDIPSKSVMGDRFPIVKLNASSRKVLSTLKSNPFDGYVINTRYYPICVIGCYLAKRNGKRPVLIDHSSGYLSDEKTLFGSCIRAYEKAVTHLVSSFHPLPYAVSERSGEWLASLGFSFLGTIPNSIDVEGYRATNSLRDWSDINKECTGVKVAYIGRLVKEKGIETVLEAIELLKRQNIDVDLFVAGNGPLSNRVGSLAESYIHYLGALSPADVCSLMSNVDILCYPSTYPEGLPSVLLEAAAHKLAIISSNCAGATDVIPAASHGIILDVPTAQNCAEAIRHYRDNPEELKAAGEHVFEHVRKNFSWKSSAEKVVAALSCS